jgi:hypothetical protein
VSVKSDKLNPSLQTYHIDTLDIPRTPRIPRNHYQFLRAGSSVVTDCVAPTHKLMRSTSLSTTRYHLKMNIYPVELPRRGEIKMSDIEFVSPIEWFL